MKPGTARSTRKKTQIAIHPGSRKAAQMMKEAIRKENIEK